MYTVSVSYKRPKSADEKIGEVEFELEENPDGSVGQIPTDGDENQDYHKVVGEVISTLVAHPTIEKISFTMRE